MEGGIGGNVQQEEDWVMIGVLEEGGNKIQGFFVCFLVVGERKKLGGENHRWREAREPPGWEAGRQPGMDRFLFFKEK